MLAKLWKPKTTQFVGVDIGSSEIKAILLNQTDDGYKVARHVAIPINKGAVVDHDIRDADRVVECLELVKRRLPKNIKYAAAAVSGSAVMTKVIYMDAALNEEEMEAQIEIEADHLIPYSLDEVSIDFETLNVNSADPSKVDILLSACRTENIDAKVDSLDRVDLETKIIDVEGYALGRAHQLIMQQLPNGAEDKIIALVDIGANMTTFAIVENGETTFTREQAIGGEVLTAEIQNSYNLSRDDAETLKINGEVPQGYVDKVLAPFRLSILQQIKRTLQIYSAASGNENVDYVVLSGGTAKLDGIANLLTAELGIKSMVADPFQGCLSANDNDKALLENNMSKYMVACGLALRSFTPWRT
ncbi:MAG: pilus assembly protein PilM [Parashewanella sp.]